MITRLRGRGEQELRWNGQLTDLVKYGYSDLRGITSAVNENEVRGIPAISRAARMRAEAVASLRLRCWRGEGADRTRVDNVWQARLFRGEPNYWQTRFDFWETVEESLAFRGNAYIWKMLDPVTARVIELWALHPDQVKCKGPDGYDVECRDGYVDPVGRGQGKYEGLGPDVILHIRGHGQGGTYEAPSPIKVFRDALRGPISRQRHENRMWGKGTALQLAIEFDNTVTPDQAANWRDMWQATYEGTGGDTTAVIGGGGSIKPIGMTAADAQFVEMAHLTVGDAARIMGVPANLLGAQLERSVPNLEQDLATWFRFGLSPELERIEAALQADEELFGDSVPNAASVYPAFDSDAFVRGDVMTEDNIAHQRIQDGRLLVDEWRKQNGLPPYPGGVGSIPQIVPVGGAPNPAPAPQFSPDPADG